MYGEVSTGAHDELVKATQLAKQMVKGYGVSKQLGPVALEGSERPTFLKQFEPSSPDTYSEETAREIDREVRQIIETQLNRASDILKVYHEKLLGAAKVLIDREVITGEELHSIILPATGQSIAL